jgi:alpha-tubulin suppressor-like RCC1 family protein
MKMHAGRSFVLVALAPIAALGLACGSSTSAGNVGADAESEAAVEDSAAPPSEGGSSGADAPEDATEAGPAAEAGGDGAPVDGGGSSGSSSGAGDSGGGCSGSKILCGGICVPNDILNCGTCGHDCTTLHATSTPTCTAGQCGFPGLQCQSGWAHCSNDASEGCEADLTQASHCGSCGMACTSSPLCYFSDAGSSCVGASAIAVGSGFAFALFSNGSIDAWGENSGGYFALGEGQLGTGSTDTSDSTPAFVASITTATAVAAGDGHACALLTGGTVACWGDNTWGQLGADPNVTDQSLVPVVVPGLSDVTAIAVGGVHTCALVSGGTVKCWGSNDYGELGTSSTTQCNGSDACSFTPTAVPGLSNVAAITIGNEIAYGADHTCALLTDKTVKCWGFNPTQQLGQAIDGGDNGVPTPIAVPGVTNVLAVSGHSGGACALITGGTVQCWGEGGDGELGNGDVNATNSGPVVVMGLTDAVSISVGATTATICAVRSNGHAVCWGNNGNDELGNGVTSTDDAYAPVAVANLTNVMEIAAGSSSTCALLSTGTVSCWGYDGDGELANATADPNDNPTPLPVQW